jgi:hypothetical protein
MDLLKQFPNNYGLKKLDKWVKNEKLKRGFSKNQKIELTKTQGAELFKEFYRKLESTSICQSIYILINQSIKLFFYR